MLSVLLGFVRMRYIDFLGSIFIWGGGFGDFYVDGVFLWRCFFLFFRGILVVVGEMGNGLRISRVGIGIRVFCSFRFCFFLYALFLLFFMVVVKGVVLTGRMSEVDIFVLLGGFVGGSFYYFEGGEGGGKVGRGKENCIARVVFF